ncbi:hypothetical protein IPM09_03455 [Candidatus Saccharibacteria bacterium]|nr:MAG: hypothetical protein IPM09_03455 [Candidatus Saccharibacteria bacterium]
MIFSGSRRSHSTPLVPADTPTAERVLRSAEYLGLDPSQTMLVGSAALCIYGVELDTNDPLIQQSWPRPSDLDFASTPLYMNHLAAHGTPTGLEAHLKPTHNPSQTILTISTKELPADIITRFRPGRDNLLSYHKRFLAYLEQHSRPVEGTAIRIITQPAALKELQSHSLDPKVARDLSLARQHFTH